MEELPKINIIYEDNHLLVVEKPINMPVCEDESCDMDLLTLLKKYIKETAKEIHKDYADKISYQAFQAMLWGRTYKNLPIYSKKKKEWFNK